MGTRAERVLAAQVIAEEPLCWLRLPGCTRVSTTWDHIITRKARPDLVMVRSNARGACSHCNYQRGGKTIEQIAHLRAVTRWEL